ncbi:P-loop containing nucleoside triphosphate hydrolase protein [Tricharina praecox]|uniref:P-loop containing nucleoside triphosphate hydrolase protein n=1 Tax=Tricharina praecox TaxID=43433 RepID=UPI0022204886|nr:P-loop containing nucleoside triphosphate hydrolase protein [Tricharina praecox]KAI5855783.1 P-loop containing nucleoside triphosphate hydrolase protein [Tricharina praecox]
MLALTPRQSALDEGGYLAKFLPSRVELEEVDAKWVEFKSEFWDAFRSTDLSASGTKGMPSRRALEAKYRVGGIGGIKFVLQQAFVQHMGYAQAPAMVLRQGNMEMAADVRFPQEWFAVTRQMHRTWHLHVGPTNSGKTYHALKRLEEVGNGIYAGPLRLLAQEIFERMNAKGIPCNLVMGDDVRTVDENATVQSSTMEMVDLNKEVDVCVIDEIQMIGDLERGWAWTEAVLGVRAKEVHMCGEERTVEIIKRLAASVGDKLTIHRYKRLGPLEVEATSLDGDLKKIQRGDCVVTFSRRNIFALKRSIEEQTGKHCAVVYGSLPPETRSTQAKLFNDENNDYDVLVASDAVGMGLNLSIKRVIFEAVEKWNGTATVAIPVPSIKQIAGRAGRYKAPKVDAHVKPDETSIPLPPVSQVGYVTTIDRSDLKAVRKALSTEVKPIKSAGILPRSEHIELFAAQFPSKKPFSEVLKQMNEYLRTSELFHPCSLRENIEIAVLFDDIEGLTVADRMTFIMAPIGNDAKTKLAVRNMANCVAHNTDGSILRISAIDLEALDMIPTTIFDLQRLEALHKALIVYLWLSYRFPATFTPRETAQELKFLCETQIEKCLKAVRFTRKKATRGSRMANNIAESLDPDAMVNLAEEKNEPDEKLAENVQVKHEDLPALEELRVEEDDRDFYAVTGMCLNCGRKGHAAAECPESKRVDLLEQEQEAPKGHEDRV